MAMVKTMTVTVTRTAMIQIAGLVSRVLKSRRTATQLQKVSAKPVPRLAPVVQMGSGLITARVNPTSNLGRRVRFVLMAWTMTVMA